MKKTLGAVTAAAVIALGLTGMAWSATAAPTTHSQLKAKAISQDVYLQLVRNSYPVFASATDDSLIAAGQKTCSMFDAGWSTDYIYDVMLIDDLGSDDGSSLVRYSVRTFCTQYGGSLR